MRSQKQRLLQKAAQEAHEAILQVCEEEGATVRAVVRVLTAELEATEVKVFNSKVVRNGQDSYQLKYSKRLAAHGPRLRAAELLMRVLQMEAPQRIEHTGEVGHRHKHELSPEIQEKLNQIYGGEK